ncbi:alpha/beta hydrolase [Actinomadura barringtoniae]|uniref:Alpha/beta hydrolase n=1 Tax=Actinomadura barringtoniae TaxID=1427535 RepID=A0A939P9Y8_9ACTN|nr:alpha/beta hydrolase [Actinomadura barringtoniae]MBO2448247.1 alpha/beta hydrolase [Actinomadura barringtoniae]
MDTTTSQDGSRIAYESFGNGPAVILIGGAFNNRGSVSALAQALTGHRAIVYDRRGRGDSNDKATGFDPAREIEDIAALIEAVGGQASLFGHSSGAVLAIAAALHGLPVTSLMAYEPPYAVDGARPLPRPEVRGQIEALVAKYDRDGAAALFLEGQVGVPAQVVAEMRKSPMWADMITLAHTLPYDVAICGPELALPDGLGDLATPTLAISGDRTQPWMTVAAKAFAAAVPNGQYVSIPGEDHSVLHRPENLAPTLNNFLSKT